MILSYDMILEILLRTNTQTNRQRIQLQRPLLSPVDRRGERANKQTENSKPQATLILVDRRGERRRTRQLELITLSASQMTAPESPS